ncbi:hypothetical protein VP01_674g5 [Puccinia sorghi]|uniref:Uncharacterized protein n=1 Tax=Puccinia sorghi TaxID=27349 RepID=A0A0L6UFJ3_9BASI|nr:hypothetical protein VP01_674g5 [Puccinia sorghi]
MAVFYPMCSLDGRYNYGFCLSFKPFQLLYSHIKSSSMNTLDAIIHFLLNITKGFGKHLCLRFLLSSSSLNLLILFSISNKSFNYISNHNSW